MNNILATSGEKASQQKSDRTSLTGGKRVKMGICGEGIRNFGKTNHCVSDLVEIE